MKLICDCVPWKRNSRHATRLCLDKNENSTACEFEGNHEETTKILFMYDILVILQIP